MSSIFQEWSTQYRSYNRNIKLFIYTNIFTQIAMGFFMMIYNFYIRELGFSEQVNGSVIAMTSLASAIVLIPAGILSDKVGRKKVMFMGILVSSAMLVLRSVLELEQLLLAAAFITGASTSFLQVSAVPWLAENSHESQRVHLFSFHFAIMTAANVVGNLLGGFLTDFFLFLNFSPLWSIRLSLLIASVIYLLGLFPILKMTEAQRQAKKQKGSLNLKEMWKVQKGQYKIIFLFAFAQMLIGFGAGLVIPYLNLYFADRFHASNSTIGLVLSLGQGAQVVATIIGPAVVRKVGEVRAVVILQLLSLPFLLLTAYTNVLWLAAVGFLFRQALMNAGNPIQASLVMSRVNDSMKGLANSINQMVFSLGWALMGPVSTTIVMKHGAYWGYSYVFTITAGLYLIGSLYFYFVFGRKKKDKNINEAVARLS